METIPFKNVAGLILIRGKVDGVEGLFVLDTGAMQTSLNRKYFLDFDGAHAEVAVFDQTMSETAAAEITLREIAVGSLSARDLQAILIDMSYVENSLRAVDPEVCFYGSIGPDFFGNCQIFLDYEHSEVTFDPDLDLSAAEKIPLSSGAFSVISVKISGEMHKFVLDTGANTCILSADLADKIAVAPLEDASGVCVIPKIKVGAHEYRDVNAVFTDISRIRSKVDADGIIGSQILSEQPSLIDLSNSALYLF